jgi:hypothetical protein
MPDQTLTVVRAKGILDVDLGEVLEGAIVVIEGNRITAVTDVPPSSSDVDQVIDLPDLTLVPGLMDMEVNLLLGGPDHASPLNAVQDDPDAVFRVGVEEATQLSRLLLDGGAPGWHFITLNRSRATQMIYADLGLTPAN